VLFYSSSSRLGFEGDVYLSREIRHISLGEETGREGAREKTCHCSRGNWIYGSSTSPRFKRFEASYAEDDADAKPNPLLHQHFHPVIRSYGVQLSFPFFPEFNLTLISRRCSGADVCH
jgi:hypothetical protein